MMPIVLQIFGTAWTDLVRLFGIWTVFPMAIVCGAIWLAGRLALRQRAEILALRADRTRLESEKLAIERGRVTDATAMLREMLRVTRETEQARAERRELDQRFLPVQEGLLAMLTEHKGRQAASP